MRHRFPVQGVACAVLALTLIAATSPVPTGFGFLPAKTGESFSYRYDATVAPAGSSVHAIVTLTRVAPDRVTLTVTPEDGQPVAYAANITQNGALQPIAARGTGQRTDAQSPTTEATPLGGIPTPYGGGGGNPGGRGGYGGGGRRGGGGYGRNGGQQSPGRQSSTASPAPRPQEARLPTSILALSSLLSNASVPGVFPRSWLFTASPGNSPVTMNLSRTAANGETIFVGDAGNVSSLHVEATVRSGRFVSARGSEKLPQPGTQTDQSPTATWTIVAFATPAPAPPKAKPKAK